MCIGGGGSAPKYPDPPTAAELQEQTDNPYANPKSGTSPPSWAELEIPAKQTASKDSSKKLTADKKKTQQSLKYG